MAPGPAQLAIGSGMTPIRVGLVSPYDLSTPGGVQAQVLGLAQYLEQSGDLPIVIGPGLPDGIPGVDLGPTIAIPGNRSRVPLSFDPRIRGRIQGAAAELDVLHVHEPLMPLVSLMATHARTPVVATFHADPGPLGQGAYRLLHPFLRRLLGDTSAITAVSETAASVLGDRAGEADIIPNGVDVSSFQIEVERVPGRICFVGRDEPRKGLDVILDAWPKVMSAHPDAELVVMGARRDGGNVRWMGRVAEDVKIETLASSSLFVAPQLGGESFGIVLVEAMAAGAAVIASDLVPFRSVAGGAARFFPVGDHETLAVVLNDLLDRPDEVGRLARLGDDRAHTFDWETVGPRYRSVYGRAIA
ncbi:MAG: glycosyltransferase family 4 protein [Acidimicrobiia bacterium]